MPEGAGQLPSKPWQECGEQGGVRSCEAGCAAPEEATLPPLACSAGACHAATRQRIRVTQHMGIASVPVENLFGISR